VRLIERPQGPRKQHRPAPILIGKLDVLRVECPKCGRFGRYPLRGLIQKRGRDLRILDWLNELTADCPRKRSASISDQCHARCPNPAEGGVTMQSP
jgi:hypothetical protein